MATGNRVGWATQVSMLPEGQAKALALVAIDGEVCRWKIDKENIQRGRTFSREAMDLIATQMLAFVEGRIMARWDQTGEPPTHLEVEIRANAS